METLTARSRCFVGDLSYLDVLSPSFSFGIIGGGCFVENFLKLQ